MTCVCGYNPKVLPFKGKLFNSTFLTVVLLFAEQGSSNC